MTPMTPKGRRPQMDAEDADRKAADSADTGVPQMHADGADANGRR